MAVNTLLEMSRSLRLYVPQCPATLAEQFIRDRYRQILERKNWSGQRAEGEFLLNAANTTGTVSVTRNNATVTGTGTTFAATDVGRQFKVGAFPVYTISTVDTVGQTLTLDRVYGGTTDSAATFTIFDGYITVPSDFLQFIDIVDPANAWKLRFNVSIGEINQMDPQRTFFGSPYVVADRLYNSGIPQYEVWPYTTADLTLYYTYYKRPADLSADSDTPMWPIRSDAIVAGALADLAKWPGTADQPNPYFARPDYWPAYEREFESKMIEIERRDEDIFTTWLQQWPYTNFQYAPSANWIQSHAI